VREEKRRERWRDFGERERDIEGEREIYKIDKGREMGRDNEREME